MTESTLRGEVSLPPGYCIHQLFELQAARTPDSIALEFEGTRLTYGELNRRANQVAHALKRRGVGPNRLVGVLMDRSCEALVGIFGVLKAGGAYVPLDPSYPAERLASMIRESGLRLILTAGRAHSVVHSGWDVEVLSLSEDTAGIAQERTENPEPAASLNDLIYVIFTSGSTGNPKGAAVYHRGFSNLIHWFSQEFAFDSNDRFLLLSSLSFDLTQKNLFTPLIRGGSLHIYPPGPYDLSLLRTLIATHHITFVNCTPSAFYPLIEPCDEATARALSSLRVVCLGGESISIPRVRAWMSHALTRAEIANTYGPTECTDICGFYRLTRENLDRYPFVPLGRPIYNAQMLILDENLAPCPLGTSGELWIGGAGVGAGYVNDAVMTAHKFIASPLSSMAGALLYRSGDLARCLPDGLIEFQGRMDHQVKVRGYRIELHEVERVVESHPSVREAVVIAQHSHASEGAHGLSGFITLKPGEAVDSEALRRHVRDRLPEYMVPGAFSFLDSFPLSPNGKVNRRALAALGSTHAAEGPVRPPTGDVQDLIRQLWCEILEIRDIGPDVSFFDAGGDSLRLAQLHLRLQSLLQREFPITQLFSAATLKAQADAFGTTEQAGPSNNPLQDRARRQREALAARQNFRR